MLSSLPFILPARARAGNAASRWGVLDRLDLFIVLAGFGLSLVYFYPGFLSNDSLNQLEQARAWRFTNWHPPSFGLLWRLLESGPIKGPLPMLVAQLGIYWAALWAIFRPITPSRRLCLLPLVAFLPPLFLNVGTIWKDVHLMLGLMAAYALLQDRKVSWIGIGLAAVAIAYATSVRHNALPAVPPLWALWAVRAFPRLFHRWSWGLAGVAMMLSLCGYLLSQRIITRIARPLDLYPLQTILLHDVVGISILEGENLLPRYLDPQKELGMDRLRRIYTPRESLPLLCCDRSLPRLEMTLKKENLEELKARWWDLVIHHPVLYLSHRLRVARRLYGLYPGETCSPYYFGIVDNPFGIALAPNPFRDLIRRNLGERTKDSLLFRSWFYFLLLCALLVMAANESRVETRLLLAILPASGILYLLPYFVVGTTCDFRMSLWPAACAILSLALMLGGIAEHRE